MSNKIGFVLGLIFIFNLLLFMFDLFALQVSYATIDTTANEIVRVIDIYGTTSNEYYQYLEKIGADYAVELSLENKDDYSNFIEIVISKKINYLTPFLPEHGRISIKKSLIVTRHEGVR